MTVTKRFLVLDAKNNVLRPCDHGIHLPDLKGEKSPSFLKMESAKAFADILASKNKGDSYYVAEVLAGTIQYTASVPAGEWNDAAVTE